MTTFTIIAVLILIGLYFFYRFAKRRQEAAGKEIELIEIEKVKAATYIVCPHCGAHLEVKE